MRKRRRQSREVPEALRLARRELDRWRGRQSGRKRLPREFWAKAVDLARVHGVNRTARTLGLEYVSLRQHLERAGAASLSPPVGPAFVELLPGRRTDPGLSCTIELEDGFVIVSRAKRTIQFPAQFMLVAAMNPCPCGYFGSNLRSCKCSPGQIAKYVAKVSGPLVDRIDIHIDVPAVAFSKLRSRAQQINSDSLRASVVAARARQTRRFGTGTVLTNAHMSHSQLEKFCKLDATSEMMLKEAMMELGLSARAHDKICKVARTIADLDTSDDIRAEHLAEAIGYRKFDRKL